MPLADGDPADEADIWFRVLTDEGYIRKGKIHVSAFKGQTVIATPPVEKNRPWSHELSGRLRSLCTNVVQEAHAYCAEVSAKTKQTKTFSGVMYCNVERRNFGERIATAIFYTPTNDGAHADFTFTGLDGASEQDLDKVRLWLIDVMTGLHPVQMHLLPSTK